VLHSWGLTADKTVTKERLDELQSVIFEKIRQKTHGSDDEGKTVKKIFRHFDIDGFGTIEFNEFTMALETLGCYFKEAELQGLFKRFDSNGNGKIDYEEFAQLFALIGSGNNPNVNPVFGAKREPPHQVIDKVKQNLKARGHHGVRSLGIVFRRIDKSKDHKLDRVEFTWGLRENGHVLTPSEFERVFKFFDRNNDGYIDYIDFLSAVRNLMSSRRSAIVAAAYQKISQSSAGHVTIDDLKGAFDPASHPRFKSGKITKD
jgi:Ca2+-binding EF-hand superfamily protein